MKVHSCTGQWSAGQRSEDDNVMSRGCSFSGAGFFAYLRDSCELRWQLHRYSATPRFFSSNKRVSAPSAGQRGSRVEAPTLLKAVTLRLDRRQVESTTGGKSGQGR